MMFKAKLVVTDIDGVWTDGGMYYDEMGNEWKKFHTYDSAGVLWLRMAGIPMAICTGEETAAVRRRANKLNVPHVFQGVKNKKLALAPLLKELDISWADVAYVGDDINDLSVIDLVGYSACPASAPKYIQSRVDVVLDEKGGEGVFRAFVEHMLGDEAIAEMVNQFGSK